MGSNLSSEQFAELCAGTLKHKHQPPSFFKPCKFTQKLPLGAVVELAFLADGTVAGNATLFKNTESVAIRGVFVVDEASRKVTTDVQLSTQEHTDSNGAPQQLVLDEESGMVKVNNINSKEQDQDDDAVDDDEAPQVEEISESAFAEQFLPPLQTDDEINAKQQQPQQQQQQQNASEAVLAAALAALGVTETEREHQQRLERELNSASRSRQLLVAGGDVSPARSDGTAASPPSPGSSSSNSRATLFDKMGTFNVPYEEDQLQQLFLQWSGGDGTISRLDFERAYRDFEADCGLEVSDKDIERVWRRINIEKGLKKDKKTGEDEDDRLSFREFQMFMLWRSKQ